MTRFIPQYNLFKVAAKLSCISKTAFWLILTFSVVPIILKDLCDSYNLINLINILNIVCISLFFILEMIIEYILIPLADNKRRDDFIDNSFGSLFMPNNSIGYYDNDEINTGLYKAAVNLFENCFFTYSLAKVATISKVIKPSIMFLFMLIIAYYGFAKVPFALSILQALFSANMLGELIKHFILLNHLASIFESWVDLFQSEDIKSSTSKYQSFIYRYWIRYESLISRINANIPEKTYNKYNPSFTEEWGKMKAKYKIN